MKTAAVRAGWEYCDAEKRARPPTRVSEQALMERVCVRCPVSHRAGSA